MSSRYCPSCGSTVQDGDTVCPVCGEPLGAPAADAAGDAARTSGQPEPASVPGRTPIPSSRMRDYLLTSVAALAIAAIALLISTPEEKAGPPAPQQQQQQTATGQMPEGHPPVNERKMTPEQERQFADLQARVKANPSDTAAIRELANVYYDLERHAEALELYRRYLVVAPRNLDVRTDMAYSLATSVNLDSGIAELHWVLRQDPDFQNAAYNLAMMHLARRDRDSTLFWLRRVMEIDSTTRPGRFAADILRDVSREGQQSGAPMPGTP